MTNIRFLCMLAAYLSVHFLGWEGALAVLFVAVWVACVNPSKPWGLE